MRMVLPLCAAMLIHAPAKADPSPNFDLWAQNARQAASGPQPEDSRIRGGNGPLDLTSLTSHPLLTVASRYMGRSGPAIGLPSRQWCRDFVNMVLAKAGHPPRDRSRRAIDAVRLGSRVRDPRPGDLAVMRHHVTIVAGLRNGKVIGLGGNQGRRVKVSAYDARRVVAFVRVL